MKYAVGFCTNVQCALTERFPSYISEKAQSLPLLLKSASISGQTVIICVKYMIATEEFKAYLECKNIFMHSSWLFWGGVHSRNTENTFWQQKCN